MRTSVSKPRADRGGLDSWNRLKSCDFSPIVYTTSGAPTFSCRFPPAHFRIGRTPPSVPAVIVLRTGAVPLLRKEARDIVERMGDGRWRQRRQEPPAVAHRAEPGIEDGERAAIVAVPQEASEPLLEREDRQRNLVLARSEEHTSELQSQSNLVCRLLLEKNNKGSDI